MNSVVQNFVNYYRPHPKDGGKYCFQFVGPHLDREGRGTRSSLGWGGTPSSGGYPNLGWGRVPSLRSGGVPHLRLGGRGVPGLRSGGVPHLRSGDTTSQVLGGVPWVPPPVKGKMFDTRFGVIHVQTGKKIFTEGLPSPPNKGKKF